MSQCRHSFHRQCIDEYTAEDATDANDLDLSSLRHGGAGAGRGRGRGHGRGRGRGRGRGHGAKKGKKAKKACICPVCFVPLSVSLDLSKAHGIRNAKARRAAGAAVASTTTAEARKPEEEEEEEEPCAVCMERLVRSARTVGHRVASLGPVPQGCWRY